MRITRRAKRMDVFRETDIKTTRRASDTQNLKRIGIIPEISNPARGTVAQKNYPCRLTTPSAGNLELGQIGNANPAALRSKIPGQTNR